LSAWPKRKAGNTSGGGGVAYRLDARTGLDASVYSDEYAKVSAEIELFRERRQRLKRAKSTRTIPVVICFNTLFLRINVIEYYRYSNKLISHIDSCQYDRKNI